VLAELRLRVGDVLSLSEFAKELDIPVDAVRFLVKKGIIRAEIKDKLKSFGPLIARKELKAFNSTYLLPSKLASKLKTNSQRLTLLLMSRGIKPLSGRKIDGGYIYIFERSAVESVDLKLLLTRRKKQYAARIASASRLNAEQAANFLGITHKELLDLIERGILKQHKRLQQNKPNKNKHIFTPQALNKCKSRMTEFKGLVSAKVAAEILEQISFA
jgi:hypothetical protein